MEIQQQHPSQSLIRGCCSFQEGGFQLTDFLHVNLVPITGYPPNSGSLSPSCQSGCRANGSVRGPNAANCLSLWEGWPVIKGCGKSAHGITEPYGLRSNHDDSWKSVPMSSKCTASLDTTRQLTHNRTVSLHLIFL